MIEPPKILIVEDQYFIAIDSEMSLHAAGFACVGLAASAEEALRLARETRPDIVVMDIRLSGRDSGLEVATQLFNELGVRSIVASGHADARIRKEAEVAHPLGWLAKPYSSTDLVCAVRHGLEEIGKDETAPTSARRDHQDLH